MEVPSENTPCRGFLLKEPLAVEPVDKFRHALTLRVYDPL